MNLWHSLLMEFPGQGNERLICHVHDCTWTVGYLRGETGARTYSLDVEADEHWLGLPQQAKTRTVLADAALLPFSDKSFDSIVNHGSVGLIGINEAARVLRPNGEMRIYPIGGQILDYWYISYYLEKVKNWPQQKIIATMERLDGEIEAADGWRPKEYVDLQTASLDRLSQKQKLEVISLLVQRYSETSGLAFLYKVKDLNAREPNGLLIYKKT